MTITAIGLPGGMRFTTALGGSDKQCLDTLYMGNTMDEAAGRPAAAGIIPDTQCCGSSQIIGTHYFYPLMVEHIIKERGTGVFWLKCDQYTRAVVSQPQTNCNLVKHWIDEQNKKHNGKIVFEYMEAPGQEKLPRGAVFDIIITLNAVDVDYYQGWKST